MTAIVAGKVVNGKVEVEDFELPEGLDVTIVWDDGDDGEVTPEEEAEIEAGIAEIERGEYVSAEESLRQVREILYRNRR